MIISLRGRLLALLAALTVGVNLALGPPETLAEPHLAVWTLLRTVHLAAALWALAATAAVVAGRAPRWLVPGALVTLIAAAPAQATPAELHGLPHLDLPVVAATAPDPRGAQAAERPATYRVRAGDSLWAIAAAHEAAEASDRRIATAVDAWHRVNRDVIGDDADLIVPGQILTAPEDRS